MNFFLFNSESGIGNNYNDSITNQLLDLSLDTNQTTEHTVNFNNNSLITSAPLVTSDSHEAKGTIIIIEYSQISTNLLLISEISLL